MITLQDFLQWERTSHDMIDFKRIYVDIAGDLVAGLVLSELVYWHLPNKSGASKMRVNRDGHQWVVARRAEWWERIRISPREFDRAVKVLVDARIIFKEVHYFAGTKALYLRINEVTFMQKWHWFVLHPAQNPHESPNSNLPHGDLVEGTKLPNGDLQPPLNHETVISITEVTVSEATEDTEDTIARMRASKQSAKPKPETQKPKRKTKKQLEAEQRDADRATIKASRYWQAFAAAYPFPDIVEPQTHELEKARETIAVLEKANIAPEKITGYVKAKTAHGKGFAFSWLSGAANLHEVISFGTNDHHPAPTAQRSTSQPARAARPPVRTVHLRDAKKLPKAEEDKSA